MKILNVSGILTAQYTNKSNGKNMSRREIPALQVLRGIAALAVVFHHAFRAVTINRPSELDLPNAIFLSNPILVEIGAIGVDIFFILSGFLMVYISNSYVSGEKTVSNFLIHRIIRIWPLYVVVTTIAAFLIYKSTPGPNIPFDLSFQRLLSFFFIPSFNSAGILQPILGVGWTLNYEAFFYLVFAITLVFARRHVLIGLTTIISLAYIFAWMLPSNSAAHVFFANSVIFEFVFGAIIASAYLNGRILFPKPTVWLVSGIVLLAFLARFPAENSLRILSRGLPAALIFIGMLHVVPKKGWSRQLILLGNASYSIYLVHVLLVYRLTQPALRRFVAYGFTGAAAELSALAAGIVCIAAGILCYFLVEQPMLKITKAIFEKNKIRQINKNLI